MGKTFLRRTSFKFKDGSSLKVHLIVNDDLDKDEHTHPWDFKSFLLIPYKEIINGKVVKRRAFQVIEKLHTETHKVVLYRILGIKIPAITFGKYSEKLQLCSFCKDLGYCKQQKN